MKKQLAEAIEVARAGERDRARQMLLELVKSKPRGRELTETVYWLSLLSTDPAEKRRYLETILRADPQHERARQQLARLTAPESASTPDNQNEKQCPNCGSTLFFSGDGRSLLCEKCGYKRKRAAAPQANRIRELEEAIRFAQQLNRDIERSPAFQQNLRLWLAAGLGAVKAKNSDEAFEYLSKVVQATQASDEERMNAWLGLAEVCDDLDEKRACFNNVLAINPREQRARKGVAILDGRVSAQSQFNPEEAPAGPQKMEAAQARQMTCPRCGGKMQFTPDEQVLECGFCHYQESLQAQEKLSLAQIAERDFLAAMFSARGHRPPVTMRTFQCQSCAIEFILVPEMLSLTCPYCDSVYVTDAAATQDTVPPDALIPPAINQNQATQRLQQWFKDVGLERPRLIHLTGVYLPAWTFDIQGQVAWMYEEYEDDGLDNSFDRFGTVQARWIKREDAILIAEDDYLVVASHKWPEELRQWVHEFDLSRLTPYDPRYLANWPAERYQITLADASLKARGDIMAPIKQRYMNLGSRTRNFRLGGQNGLVVESYKLILLPLWLGHYELEGKRYPVMVNGQNGEVRGSRPRGGIRSLISWFTGE